MPAWSSLGALRSPAGAEALAELEESLGQRLPPDYRDFLLAHDGQNEPGEWVEQTRLLSVAEIGATRRLLAELELDLAPRDRGIEHGHRPLWVPVARLGRSFLALDLEPAESGERGQVIGFRTDEDEVRWVARSFVEACRTVYCEKE